MKRTRLRVHPSEMLQQSPVKKNVPKKQDSPSVTIDPSNIAQLQHTIGNQSVQRVLGLKKSASKKSKSADIMSFAEFVKATGQDSSKERQQLLSGEIGGDFLDQKRGALGMKQHNVKIDINRMYQEYEKDPTNVQKLLILHSQITYWQTMYHGMPQMKQVEWVLDVVVAQIKARIQAETERQWKASGADGAKAGMSVEKTVDQVLAGGKKGMTTPMPEFLSEIGIPAAYFDEYLAGKNDLLKALQLFYVHLKAGQTYQASMAFRPLENLPGIAFIKSLFLAKFPQQARLDKLIGTEDQGNAGSQLTPQEIRAIRIYSSQAYRAINEQMRGHDMKSALRIGERQTEEVTENGKTQTRKKRTEADQAYDRRNIMRLVVSGLNKLPKYQGVAYRTLQSIPENLFKVIRKGATTTDLGFSSAASSFRGVETFSSAWNVIFVIHAKTPANIVAYSENPQEAEVLFRPGTRFRVNDIWQAMDGKAPLNAPVDVQMVFQNYLTNKYGYQHLLKQSPSVANQFRVVEITEV